MSRRPLRRSALHLATLIALAATQTAHAITFERLNAEGTGSGDFYVPTLSDWVLAPDAAESRLTAVGNAWQIDVGTANFGSPESGQQTSGIFGAGLILPSSTYGWRVNFDANLRTWDSYNDGAVVQPNPNGSLGDWDLFAVNTNQQNFYWNLVAQGSAGNPELMSMAATPGGTGLMDPLVPVRPAGSVVSYRNTDGNTSYLPGHTWAWGGRDYAAGYFESVHTQGQVIAASGAPQYVSFVLDSRTPAYNDQNYPSWGRFGVVGQAADDDVPGGELGEGPGGSINNPILPIGTSATGGFVFSPIEIGDSGIGIDSYLYLDPVVAVGYEFTLTGGNKFKEIVLPNLGDADGYTIEVLNSQGKWVKLAQVADGGAFSFDDGVTTFRIVGIDAALGLNPENPAAFITGVKLDGAGTAQFGMQPLTAAVPEPESLALLAAGALTVLTLRRRQRRA